jgi:beta-xylosidase
MNPIIPDIGMSDPHLRVHDGRIWLFTGHDQDPDDETWVMPDWRIYSSTDLVDWREEGVIDPSATYLGAGSTDCWAGDAIHRDGRWWWYCSDHARSIGVSTATEPAGPWSDPVGGPLAKHHDPTVVVDEHQQHWLIWGAKDHDGYQVAPLAATTAAHQRRRLG